MVTAALVSFLAFRPLVSSALPCFPCRIFQLPMPPCPPLSLSAVRFSVEGERTWYDGSIRTNSFVPFPFKQTTVGLNGVKLNTKGREALLGENWPPLSSFPPIHSPWFYGKLQRSVSSSGEDV